MIRSNKTQDKSLGKIPYKMAINIYTSFSTDFRFSS